jgi:hypothetical protein
MGEKRTDEVAAARGTRAPAPPPRNADIGRCLSGRTRTAARPMSPGFGDVPACQSQVGGLDGSCGRLCVRPVPRIETRQRLELQYMSPTALRVEVPAAFVNTTAMKHEIIS